MLLTKITTGLKLAVILAIVSFVYVVSPAQAQIPTDLELNGYAWSSNIGWISLNCKTGGVNSADICSTVNYGVSINQTTRNLTGFAWSPNVGWIKFDGLSGFPTGNGTTQASARLGSNNYTSTNIEGWARACAGLANSACTGIATSTVAGGWDGWISFSGSTLDGGNYQVNTSLFGTTPPATSSPAYRNRFAWGGDVVGWVDFVTNVSWYLPPSISGTGCSIPVGSNTCNGSLTWSIPTTYINPSVVGTAPAGQNYSNTSRTGNNVSVPMRFGTNTFVARSNSTVLATTNVSVSCVSGSDFNGTTCEPTAIVPTISLTPSQRLVRRGTSVTLTAVSDPDSPCTITGGGTTVNITATTGGFDHTTGPINNQTRFTLTCSGVTATTIVDVLPTVDEI